MNRMISSFVEFSLLLNLISVYKSLIFILNNQRMSSTLIRTMISVMKKLIMIKLMISATMGSASSEDEHSEDEDYDDS